MTFLLKCSRLLLVLLFIMLLIQDLTKGLKCSSSSVEVKWEQLRMTLSIMNNF